MRAFASTISNPWDVIGDFNSILNVEEKLGGNPHRLYKILPFMECLFDCDLVDMGYFSLYSLLLGEISILTTRVLITKKLKFSPIILNLRLKHVPRN